MESTEGMSIMYFAGVIEILDKAVGGPGEQVSAHGAFWRGISRDEFIKKKVFGRALVALGDGVHSNLVLALKGELPFGDDPQAEFPRMPAGGLDAVPVDSIRAIEQWINDGCPEGPTSAEATGRATDT